jgi:DNA polymerase-3 subunit epsilon
MRLFFDVETTGLPERNLPPNDPRQPHLVQLACLLCEDDGTERASVSLIVRPPVPIPDEVAAIHGITNGIAAAAGVPPAAAFGIWSNLARRAGTLVAHNIAFDEAIMLTAWCRQHVGSAEAAADDWARMHGDRERFCTMKAATSIVNLPPTPKMLAAGMRRPKPPKLEECVRHFFGEDLAGAHDALVDVRACARVYHHIKSLERAAA